MAKKKGKKPETKKAHVNRLCKATGFSPKIVSAAIDAGFIDVQIKNFSDPNALKALAIKHKPGLAVRFMEVPKAPTAAERQAKMVEVTHEFECLVMAGFGPMNDHARREQEQIDRELRRRGIGLRNKPFFTIERDLTLNKGKFVSKVTVKYLKEGE
jgi:hypothetical protein